MRSSPVLCQETQKTHRTTEDQFSSLPRTRENGLGLTRKSRLTKPVFTPTGQTEPIPTLFCPEWLSAFKLIRIYI